MDPDRVLFIDGEALVIDKPAGLPVDRPRALAFTIGGLATLAFDLPALLRHALQLGTQLLQLALGLAGGLRSTRQGQGQRHSQPQQQPAPAAYGGDVMSA